MSRRKLTPQSRACLPMVDKLLTRLTELEQYALANRIEHQASFSVGNASGGNDFRDAYHGKQVSSKLQFNFIVTFGRLDATPYERKIIVKAWFNVDATEENADKVLYSCYETLFKKGGA